MLFLNFLKGKPEACDTRKNIYFLTTQHASLFPSTKFDAIDLGAGKQGKDPTKV